jgi:hypothetical protein
MCFGIVERQGVHSGSCASRADLMMKVRGGNDGCTGPMVANQIAAKAQLETN